MTTESKADIRETVRERYAGVAEEATPHPSVQTVALAVGYSQADLAAVPEGANLGLGCGNPVAQAALRPGDVVLDLGSGAGFDAFIAARTVGTHGRVIGVDMTPAMVEKARANAVKAGVTNVDFRLGTIEELPLESASVDVVLSNCVINLSPEKRRVFAEAFRVLRPGGRLLVSDIVTLGELPAAVRASAAAYVGCIAGVSLKDDYLRMVRDAGFEHVEIVGEKAAASLLGIANGEGSACACADPTVSSLIGDVVKSMTAADLMEAARLVVSVQLAARKPA